MKVYHQTGHNSVWNLDSIKKGIGDGMIFSPVNIDADKLRTQIPKKIKSKSFLDPQLYLLNETKGSLETYPYFPGNIKPDFGTSDLDNDNQILAQKCIDYQLENDFEYIVIPTKYYEENPTNYLAKCAEYFVNPFYEYSIRIKTRKKILLSVIVKNIMLIDPEQKNEILNWITGQPIDGVYLIFENNFNTKQIKDFDFLINSLWFIKILKDNGLEVHIGYTNTEAFIFTVAMPDSVSIASYENLRSFGIKRFQDKESGPMRSPNARLFSGRLLQWIDYGYVQSIKRLVDNYEELFEESEYNPLNFEAEINWQFKQTGPYKHYFHVFYNQLKNLPTEQDTRIEEVKNALKTAIQLFKKIEHSDVLLDENSDGSHLPIWYNVVNSFQKSLNL